MRPFIFIIDDNEMMREFLTNYFISEYRVMTFESAEQAMAYMRPDRFPDLILVDYKMEGMDGFSLLKNLKTSEYYKEIPVIFLSSAQKSDVRIQCLMEGAEDFITKPFNPVELTLRIQKTLTAKTVKS